jgi:hypothetical protein
MSDISQLASRVWGRRGGEEEWGNTLPLTLHYLHQGEGQGGRLCFLPLEMVPEYLGFSPPDNKCVHVKANLRVPMLVETMQEMVAESLGFSPPYNKSVPDTAILRVSMLVETMQEMVAESLGFSHPYNNLPQLT